MAETVESLVADLREWRDRARSPQGPNFPALDFIIRRAEGGRHSAGRLELDGMGREVVVSPGEHRPIQDHNGDPICACGYAATPSTTIRTVYHAAADVRAHVRASSSQATS